MRQISSKAKSANKKKANLQTSKSRTNTKKKSRSVKARKKTKHTTLFKCMPKWTVWIGLFLVAIISILLFYYLFIDPYSFRWKNMYGDPIYPKGFDIHGIDISHYQEEVDWELVRNASLDTFAIHFAFIKATEGEDLMDEHFEYNFCEAKRNDLIRGAYHFFTPSNSAQSQAAFFIKQVKLEAGDLPPVLDVEKSGRLSAKQLQDSVKVWLNLVEKHYKVKPIIYTGHKFKLKYLNAPEFNDYPYWIAHYYIEELKYKGEWLFWQHTDRGEVNGINGRVDCNIFNGSLEELLELTIKTQLPEDTLNI